MSTNTRHSSMENLKDTYKKPRPRTTDNSSLSTAVPTVYEEEEEEWCEEDRGKNELNTTSNTDYKAHQNEFSEDDDSIYSSSSSIPDENIDFDLVYALHTFVATLDGQASVVKGDSMTLLDDSNSYWWLVRALKTSEVGYIPAENIETPFERLARLNKHRNVEVTLPVNFLVNSESKQKGTVSKRVKLSKVLSCQLEVIFVDKDQNEELVYEQWVENVSTESLIEEKLENSKSETGTDSESTILNTCFNKPIGLQTGKLPEDANKQQFSQPDVLETNKSNKFQQKPTSGFKRLFSIANKKEKILEDDNQQFHVLRIFAENISIGAMFTTVAVTPEMNADQLLRIALEKFHIPSLAETSSNSNSIEYYLTVKSMDSDELIMLPQDKPLAIFESLSDHLTTPMPSLTYIKKLSIEQPTIKVTRVGVSKARQRAKAHFGEDSVIRFALHKRIKHTVDGKTYVKIAYYCNEDQKKTGVIRKSSLLRKESQPKKLKKERIDKLIGIYTSISISELIATAIEKFHLSLTDQKSYYMTLSTTGNTEKALAENKTLTKILNDVSLVPKGSTERVFILRKRKHSSLPESTESSRISIVRKLIKQPDSFDRPTLSNTDHVIKKLDEAIQLLELDKGKIGKYTDLLKRAPVRPNSSLECETEPRQRFLPSRSTSLKLVGDTFDTSVNNCLSNMDDLELELHRIATSS